jgi:hypothetical protein
MMTAFDTDLIPRETLATMVTVYQKACTEIDQAYAMLAAATKDLVSAYGDNMEFAVIPSRIVNLTEIKGKVKQTAWRDIIDRLELSKIMSIKDLDNIRHHFEDINKLPEIDLPTVMDISIGMMSNQAEYAKRLVDEVYIILMPGNSERNKYKTNEKYARRALGKKVILPWKVEMSYSNTFRAFYGHCEDELIAVDKVFYALDGKGIPGGYRSPLVDAINTTSNGLGETEYFKFKCCLNHNLHLEFKRMDLVSKLNQIAGCSNLIAD